MTLPIPARCAHRPTLAGLVVPYISLAAADGRFLLGAVHDAKRRQCIVRRLCQVCSLPLDGRLVVFARPFDLVREFTAEPALHPECAAYSGQACPMLAGRMEHYRSSPHDVDGMRCGKAGCECVGWVSAPDQAARSGAPAEPYHAVWLPDYRVAVDDKGVVSGLSWQGIRPLRIRAVVPVAGTPLVDAVRKMAALMAYGGVE